MPFVRHVYLVKSFRTCFAGNGFSPSTKDELVYGKLSMPNKSWAYLPPTERASLQRTDARCRVRVIMYHSRPNANRGHGCTRPPHVMHKALSGVLNLPRTFRTTIL